MNKTNIRYWLCQFFGWGVWGVIILYFNLVVFSERMTEMGGKKEFMISLVIYLFAGILSTHLLRFVIKKTSWLRYSFNHILLLFLLGVGGTGLLLYYGANVIEHKSAFSYDNFTMNKKLEKAKNIETQYGIDTIEYYNTQSNDSIIRKAVSEIKKATGWHRNKEGIWVYEEKNVLLGIYQTISLIAIWMLFYIVYHYVQKVRKDQLDRLKLESTVKELELKTIKSHINPHFIFNSLNSIRALVDENPQRARTAITELSNILRSSLQTEKLETVRLETELNIVKDYLALEQMRFEERLKIEFDIDEDSLDQQVPPMMLQTLVENAIKHGISKRIDGGTIKVIADFVDNHLELVVQNSGQLNGYLNNDGFGVRSTEDRLNLLYQGKASFSIRNLGDKLVESKITMPVTII